MVVQGRPVSNWYHCRGAGIFREEFVQKFCLLQWQSTLKAVCITIRKNSQWSAHSGFSSCPEKPQQASNGNFWQNPIDWCTMK